MKTRALLFLSPLLLLSACMNTTPVADSVHYYLPLPDAHETKAVTGAPTAGIRELRLPAYLDTRRVAVRQGGSELIYNDFTLWGEPLEQAAGVVFAKQLRARLGEGRVDTFPWTDGVAHEVVLRVQMDRFEGDSDGGVHVTGRVIITPASGTAAVVPFDYEGNWKTGDYNSLAQALGNALDRLANDVAIKLATR